MNPTNKILSKLQVVDEHCQDKVYSLDDKKVYDVVEINHMSRMSTLYDSSTKEYSVHNNTRLVMLSSIKYQDMTLRLGDVVMCTTKTYIGMGNVDEDSNMILIYDYDVSHLDKYDKVEYQGNIFEDEYLIQYFE